MIANIILISFSILMLLIIANNKNNTYVWIFAGMFMSLNIVFVSMIFYIVKLSNYYSSFGLEKYIIMRITKMNINFFRIRLYVNVGIVLFMMSKFCFVSASRMKLHRVRRLSFLLVCLVMCILYMYINSFEFIQRLHIMKNTAEGAGARYTDLLIRAVRSYNTVLLAVSIMLPYIAILLNYYGTTLAFKKKQCRLLMIFLGIIDVFFMTIFVFGAFRGKVINNIDFETLTYYDSVLIDNKFLYFSLIALIIINIVYAIMAKYRFFDSVSLFKNKVILKKIKLLPVDIRNVNHSYKNSVFAIKIICDEIKEEYGGDKKLEQQLGQIDKIASDVIGQLDMFSKLTNSDIKEVAGIDIKECIDTALSRLVAKDIEIEKDYGGKPCCVLGESSQIIEALYNILVNSVEAIKISGKADGKIKISLYSDIDWVCISVWDNGCGIKRKDMKKLYNPLFSTKKTNRNWGIGLSYSYKVIKAHLGIIFCESVYGSYTEFQILLPSEYSKKNIIW